MNRRQVMVASLLLAVATVPLTSLSAEEKFPARAVRLVVPFAPGGSVDVSARIIATLLQEEIGQAVVVENRTGAGGRVGASAVATAPPDGYTLLVGSSGSLTAQEAVSKSVPYRMQRDFTPVAQLNITPMVIEAGPGSKAQSLADLIAEAKAKPGAVGMASAGIGSSNHLAIELLQSETGGTFLHVPYRGSGQAIADVAAGQVPTMVDQIASSIGYIRDNKFRALAVMSTTRSALLPNVPTTKELGFGELQAASFTGILAPAKTPEKIVSFLERAIVKVSSRPDVTKRFADLGAEPKVVGRSEFGKFLNEDLERWKGVARKANISLD